MDLDVLTCTDLWGDYYITNGYGLQPQTVFRCNLLSTHICYNNIWQIYIIRSILLYIIVDELCVNTAFLVDAPDITTASIGVLAGIRKMM